VQEELRRTFEGHPYAPSTNDPPTKALTPLHAWSYYPFDQFKAAVDDLETQYLKLRNARKELYMWDSTGECGFTIRTDAAAFNNEIIGFEL